MHTHTGLKHKRERGEKLQKEQRGSSYKKALDKVTFVAGILGPFMVIPQIYAIFTTHNASGVSITSWVLLTIVTAPWVFYGFAHKDKAIITSFMLWEVANLLVVVGAVMYQ